MANPIIPDPYILHIETSAARCSIALSLGPDIIATITADQNNTHSTVLAPDVRDLLANHDIAPTDLHAISVSAGPGSYTGLRVGISFAKAMCYALKIPLIAVDTLESLAMAAREALNTDAIYYPNIDARRMEVYIAAFDATGTRISPNSAWIIDENTFAEQMKAGETIVFCGTGTAKCTEVLKSEAIVHYPMECSATHLVAPALRAFYQGDFADLVEFSPNYVKAPNITVSTKPLI